MLKNRPNFRRLKKKNHEEPQAPVAKYKRFENKPQKEEEYEASKIKTRSTSVSCKGYIIRPPSSTPMPTRNGIAVNKKANNFNLRDVPEKFVTQAVYMGSGIPIPVKKKFNVYSHISRNSGHTTAEIKLVYMRNTMFLIRAISTRVTNIRVITDQARKLEDWYIYVMRYNPSQLVSADCPQEIARYLSTNR